MRVVTVHRLLLFFWAALATVIVVRARLAPEPASRPVVMGVTDAIPGEASLLVTVDLAAWRGSEVGRAIGEAPQEATPLGEVRRACVGDPTAGVRAVALGVPSRALASPDADLELGLAAVGDLDAGAVANCAAAIVRLHGGDPVRAPVGSFLAVRDRDGASEGEVAVRDGGPVLLSGGRYLRDMIDAAEGRAPSVASDPRHHELRTAVGGEAAVVASWVAPTTGEALAGAFAGAPADDLDHVRAVAAGLQLAPGLEVRVLIWCDAEAPCQSLAASLDARLREATGPIAELRLGFDPRARTRVESSGERLTLTLRLEPNEARRLVELALSAWSPRGADGAAQQP